MSGLAFRGASLTQDTRFRDKDVLELKKRKYPPSFDLAVDMKKIQFDVIKKWLTKRVTELNSGQEDETLVGYIVAMLEEKVYFFLPFLLIPLRIFLES